MNELNNKLFQEISKSAEKYAKLVLTQEYKDGDDEDNDVSTPPPPSFPGSSSLAADRERKNIATKLWIDVELLRIFDKLKESDQRNEAEEQKYPAHEALPVPADTNMIATATATAAAQKAKQQEEFETLFYEFKTILLCPDFVKMVLKCFKYYLQQYLSDVISVDEQQRLQRQQGQQPASDQQLVFVK
ncbi:hypothetical protein RFI_10276, partial [Reticulomyxa filosa]